MRTTLDIDEDILLAAREHASRERRSIGAVISRLARESLRRPATAGAGGGAGAQGGRFAVLPAREEVITAEHIRGVQDVEGV
ncbi:MAG: hypothetical protein LBV61_08745 [Burkholderiaceae bacterium]|jgi:hypothetical protein|nr:hypothetical protein [Burkholderiaceae bacterium]